MSDTIARLAAMRARPAGSEDGSPGRLLELTGFGSNPGALRAKYHLPENLPEAAPLVVVLHGCTQTAAAYDRGSGWSQLADQAGFAVLYPEQQRANNANLCFNWFLPEDTGRDRGEALSIRQMIDAMVATHAIDPRRIFITGLSAGGAMASAMLAAYPEIFAGGAIIAGLAYGTARTIPEAFDRMRGHGSPSEGELQRLLRSASSHQGPWPKISIWQGTADHTVAASNADAIVAQWRGVHGLGNKPEPSRLPGGLDRRIWRNVAQDAVLEVNLIAGMGHGTPLGDDGLGTPGPYMLDVGISSTREIANFWGIGDSTVGITAKTPIELPPEHDRRASSARGAEHKPTPPQPSVPDPRKIIEDALRTAGLMR